MTDKKEEALARWRGLVTEQMSSGKSVAAFCRERGLREWQLYEWKKRLRGSEATPLLQSKFHLQKHRYDQSYIPCKLLASSSIIVAVGA